MTKFTLAVLAAFLAAICSALISATSAEAQYYMPYGNNTVIIQPKHRDITPGDGIFDQGSYTNPYQIKTQEGSVIGTIRPQHYDITPGDGIRDAGSYSNPYIVEYK